MAQSFRYAVDKVIEIAPDVILVAGDVFHQVRPPNSAIVQAYHHFARLRAALPDAEVVMVAGNHDTPRSTESGSIIRLFSQLGFHVVDGPAQMLEFPKLELSVLAAPMNSHPLPALRPVGNSKYNVLLLHGVVEGEYPEFARPKEMSVREIPQDELHANEWDYIALGHYHVYKNPTVRRDNVFFAGAIDYTSSNIWGEKAEEMELGVKGKRFIERNLAARTHRHHDIPHSREFVAIDAFSARGMTTEELNEAIVEAVESVKGGIEDKVVRLVVFDVPRHVARQLDHRRLREYRKRALHFQLDTYRPETIRNAGRGAPGRRASLDELVRDKLRERLIPPDVDREALVDLGVKYLKDAEERETVTAVSAASADG